MSIFRNTIKLTVDEAVLNETIATLNLPFTASYQSLKEVLRDTLDSSVNEVEINKCQALKEWLFVIMVTYKELETAIIYATANKPTELYGEWYDSFYNQPFYNGPCSFFTNQAASLSFSLGEKTAQFVNVLESINLDEKNIKLADFNTDTKVKQYVNPINQYFDGSTIHNHLKSLSISLNKLKEIRNSKTHRLDAEISTVRSTIYEAIINDETPTLVIMNKRDKNRYPTTLSNSIDKIIIFFNEATAILDKIFDEAITKTSVP